ncbi:hypothetical protein PK28_17180 (plasmid) [Hymenobacter sp. DG25B]|uniref:alpha-2-macroglobulin family protein n=1 Tax=Hymenobacter sp. DG25B TaxID=1385664 RepID=UPI000540A6A5|nr:alpha-2-macroglobulin family protein [Hymenobacter sp. DG25B]AIZ65405.1 hypothetical protein PK28_17180 [Hymenobacter sp. DG25B]
MMPDTKQLSEVVVTGFGFESVRRDFSGQVAGIQVGGAEVRIRGTASLTTTPKRAPPRTIPEVPLLASGDKQYALRRHFSDYAWWRPALFTDSQGKASTEVILPDDVTGWNTFVLASDDHGRTGRATGSLRSCKAVLGELMVPRFLVQGDQVQVLGKALNYLPDTSRITTTFQVNGAVAQTNRHELVTAIIDTLRVTAPAAGDSLQLTYRLQQESGYQDGEVRRLAVLPRGTRERVGTFAVLTARDTTLQLPVNPRLGPVTVRLESDPLPELEEEIRHLQRYPYLCNEQAASKLKGLLVEQRIRQFRHQPFTGQRAVHQLIRTLLAGRREGQVLWGTWAASPASPWVSLHVVEALLEAEQLGYRVALDRPALEKQLLGQHDQEFTASRTSQPSAHLFQPAADRIRLLQLLQRLGTALDYATYLKRIEQSYRGQLPLDVYLATVTLRQALHLPYQLDTLRRFRRTTLQGGVFYEDSVQGSAYYQQQLPARIGNTLLAYAAMRQQGGQERELLRLRTFLLQQRPSGHWGSTYESARILETITPDLLAEGAGAVAATVRLRGPCPGR